VAGMALEESLGHLSSIPPGREDLAHAYPNRKPRSKDALPWTLRPSRM